MPKKISDYFNKLKTKDDQSVKFHENIKNEPELQIKPEILTSQTSNSEEFKSFEEPESGTYSRNGKNSKLKRKNRGKLSQKTPTKITGSKNFQNSMINFSENQIIKARLGPSKVINNLIDVSEIHKKFTVHPEDLKLHYCKISLEDIMSKKMSKYGDSDEDSEAAEEDLKTESKFDNKNLASVHKKTTEEANEAMNTKFVRNVDKSLRINQKDDFSIEMNYSGSDVKIEDKDPEIIIPENSKNLSKNIENDEERQEILNSIENVKYEPEKQLLIVLTPEKIVIKNKIKQDGKKSTKGLQCSSKSSQNLQASNKGSKNLQTIEKFLKAPQNSASVSKGDKNEAECPKNARKSSKETPKISKSLNKKPQSAPLEPKILSKEQLKILSNFNRLGLKQYECKICQKLIVSFYFLEDHIRRHETKKPKCDDCGKIFLSKYFFQKHNCEAKCKFCEICKKKFSFTTSYRLHMKNLHPELLKESLFECDLCAEAYLKKFRIRIHMEQKHLRKREEFICDFDGKRFKKRAYLFNHMEKHVAPTVECKICGAKLKEGSIYQHTLIMHSEKTFSCKICPKTFKSLAYLKLHKKYHEKKFSCEICGKRFGNNFEVDRHVRDFHENPRSYGCNICGKKFKTSYSLKYHLKIHMEDRPKPFKCTKCSLKFYKKTVLRKHLEVHRRNEERVAKMKNPVQCEICKYFCRSKAALAGHKTRVHPKNTFQCDHCGNVLKLKGNFLRHLSSIHGFYICGI